MRINKSRYTARLWRCLVILSFAVLSAPNGFAKGSKDGVRTVDFHDDAAWVSVSVDAIAPWSEYRDALTVNFELTEQQALTEVLPTTARQQSSYMNAIRAALNLAPSVSGVSGSTVLNQQTGSPNSWSSTSTKTVGNGVAAVPELGVVANGGLPSLDTGLDVIAKDPFLRYLTAQSLYQEVKILNRYLKDAAISDEFVPLFVRMNIRLDPASRRLPYDTMVGLSFFQGGALSSVEAGVTEFVSSGSLPEVESASFNSTKLEGLAIEGLSVRPKVLPLLVRDNLEFTVSSQSEERVRSFAATLATLNAGNALGAGFGFDSSYLRSVLGRDANTLYSISKVTDNGLMVRIGSPVNGSGNKEMVPRNHSVTFVLLVPKSNYESCDPKGDSCKPTDLRLLQTVSYVDPSNGDTLIPNTDSFLLGKALRVLERQGSLVVPRGVNIEKDKRRRATCYSKIVKEAYSAYLEDNAARFVSAIGTKEAPKKCPSPGEILQYAKSGSPSISAMSIRQRQELWNGFGEVAVREQTRSYLIDLPKPNNLADLKWAWENIELKLGYKNDGKVISVVIPGLAKPIGATYEGYVCAKKPSSLCVGPDSVKYDEKSQSLTLIYFEGYSASLFDKKTPYVVVKVRPRGQQVTDFTGSTKLNAGVELVSLPTKSQAKPKPAFKMVSQSVAVVADEGGRGTAALFVDFDEERIKSSKEIKGPFSLSISGASLEAVTVNEQVAKPSAGKGAVSLSADSQVMISFSNLVPFSNVVAKLSAKSGSTPVTISLPVFRYLDSAEDASR